jgi:hypothetical protein
MTLHAFSRRRLLGGLLASLSACLCPRAPRISVSRRSKPAVLHHFSAPGPYTTTYTYDAGGGEKRFADTYVYDGNGRLLSAKDGYSGFVWEENG